MGGDSDAVGGDVEVSMSPAGDAVHCIMLGAAVGADVTIGIAVVGANDANGNRVGTGVVGCIEGSPMSGEGGSIGELVGADVGIDIGAGACVGVGSCCK